MKNNLYHSKGERGMTILFASLVVSLLLSIAIAITSIALSQLTLTSAAKDSAYAFYAADTGIDCALYYENKMLPDDRDSYFPSRPGETASTINCNGGVGANIVSANSVQIQNVSGQKQRVITTYVVNSSSGTCDATKPSFTIIITKQEKSVANTYSTLIQSRGYSSCGSNNPRRVERGLQVKY